MKALPLLVLAVLASHAAAQAFPTKAVRIIVPFAPGGGTDNLTRVMAPRLTELLGQPIVVDNRAGGNSQIGTELAARAAPAARRISGRSSSSWPPAWISCTSPTKARVPPPWPCCPGRLRS